MAALASPMFWPARVVTGHPRIIAAAALGVVSWLVLPRSMGATTRAVSAWDIGMLCFLALAALLFWHEGDDARMAENAKRQQEGEWTVFWMTLFGVAFSFIALTSELQNIKDLPPAQRSFHIGLVAATLLLSWTSTHILFAMRYAHEYYTTTDGRDGIDGGLDFPKPDGTPDGEAEKPDYWDFTYFSLVLGMTFQVSDVEITSKKLRRLATVHGLVGFLFNTVIVALTVNIAASLLG